jgi:hypothetical protein
LKTVKVTEMGEQVAAAAQAEWAVSAALEA